jgi:hypothetical protein
MDFIRGETFSGRTLSGPGEQTSAGAEAGTTSVYRISERKISYRAGISGACVMLEIADLASDADARREIAGT